MSKRPAAMKVLQARAEARAYLVLHGELELAEAVETLWQYALDSGVADQLGEAGAAAIIRNAFAGVAEL